MAANSSKEVDKEKVRIFLLTLKLVRLHVIVINTCNFYVKSQLHETSRTKYTSRDKIANFYHTNFFDPVDRTLRIRPPVCLHFIV